MEPFVYRLVERLTADRPPLSRNRHFHTFQSPEGREALRIARHLRSLARDLAAASRPFSLRPDPAVEGKLRLEIVVQDGLRTTWLAPEAWELLRRMPAVRAALGELAA